MLMDHPVRPGDAVVVSLNHAPTSNTVRLAAQIRWVAPLAGQDGAPLGYVAGVRFAQSRGLLDMLLRE
jgi:hypothetical protein